MERWEVAGYFDPEVHPEVQEEWFYARHTNEMGDRHTGRGSTNYDEIECYVAWLNSVDALPNENDVRTYPEYGSLAYVFSS